MRGPGVPPQLRPESMPVPVQVLFVLLPDSLLLDWAGPAEALRFANQILADRGTAAPFELRYIGPQAQTGSSVGLTLAGIEPLPKVITAPAWVVLVGAPGSVMAVHHKPAKKVIQWLRGLTPVKGRLELVTVCAGAVLAAHAGLLAGRQATTHHQHLEELAQVEPSCEVLRNRVFVNDGPVHTSAGVTTGIDLMLHRIGTHCGPALAAQVAQRMVVALRRGPGDPELSPFLAYRNHMHPVLHRVQDAIGQQPQRPWTVALMAAAGCTSARHLTRLFVDHAGIAPLQYLRRLRLATAQAALQSGMSVTQAAAVSGFGSDTQLRRAWRRFGQDGTPRHSVALLQKS